MSSDAAPTPYMSYADFVVFEENSLTRHEWLDGVVYDMSGGTIDHARLKARVNFFLSLQLYRRRCQVFESDLAVHVLATKLCTYPDVVVVCRSVERDPANRNAVTNPQVIVEVLSDSTEKFDRNEKFAHYKRIPSLAEYVLVSQYKPCIEVFRQTSPGNWELVQTALAGQTATLASLECELSVDEVYADPLADA